MWLIQTSCMRLCHSQLLYSFITPCSPLLFLSLVQMGVCPRNTSSVTDTGWISWG